MKDVVHGEKTGVVPHAATLLYRTAYRGTSDTTHYALEWDTPTNFSANILRKKSAQALAPLLVAALSKTRRKILGGEKWKA